MRTSPQRKTVVIAPAAHRLVAVMARLDDSEIGELVSRLIDDEAARRKLSLPELPSRQDRPGQTETRRHCTQVAGTVQEVGR
jgi:hypothetical protein